MGLCPPFCPLPSIFRSDAASYNSHPQFSYDEIDDLEFENLLNADVRQDYGRRYGYGSTPATGYGNGNGRGFSRHSNWWDAIAGLFVGTDRRGSVSSQRNLAARHNDPFLAGQEGQYEHPARYANVGNFWTRTFGGLGQTSTGQNQNITGYQAVPTLPQRRSSSASSKHSHTGSWRSSSSHGGNLGTSATNVEAFLKHEEDAQMLSDEEIKRRTSSFRHPSATGSGSDPTESDHSEDATGSTELDEPAVAKTNSDTEDEGVVEDAGSQRVGGMNEAASAIHAEDAAATSTTGEVSGVDTDPLSRIPSAGTYDVT
ncbi:hypothetical protein BC832DRAFT_591437 [Gaertneriomyces semiglobifer]|nr:hypothetical protein BC832DRAFT_591437 [Gaertneriomyces semiglobifer]